MLTGPIRATERALTRASLKIGDIETYEINKAFAPVPLAWVHDVGGEPDRPISGGCTITLSRARRSSGSGLWGTGLKHLQSAGGHYYRQGMCAVGGLAKAANIELL